VDENVIVVVDKEAR